MNAFQKELDRLIALVDCMHNAAIDERDYEGQELCSQAMNALLEVDGPNTKQLGRLISKNCYNAIAVNALGSLVQEL